MKSIDDTDRKETLTTWALATSNVSKTSKKDGAPTTKAEESMRHQSDFMISRRDFLMAIAATAAGTGTGVQAAAAAVPSLKDTCKGIFLIGTALDFRTPDEFTAIELD